MRLAVRAAVTGGLFLFSPLCAAAGYVGGDGVLSSYEYEDMNRSLGGRVYFGYRGEANPVFLQFDVHNSGKAEVDDSTSPNGDSLRGGSLSFTGYVASLGYAPVISPSGSRLWGRVGYYRGDSKMTGVLNSPSNGISNLVLDGTETSSGFAWGLGGEWMLAPQLAFRLELGALSDVKDLPGLDPDHKSDVAQTSIGLAWYFSAPAAPVRNVSAPVASTAAPAPAPAAAAPSMPAAMATPPPAPPLAPLPPAGPTAAVSTILRVQPKSQSRGIAAVPAGAPVVILGEISNGEGRWYYATVSGQSGWLADTEVKQP